MFSTRTHKKNIFQSNPDTIHLYLYFYLWLVRDLPSFDARSSLRFYALLYLCSICCLYRQRHQRRWRWWRIINEHIASNVIKSNCLNALLSIDRTFTCYLSSIVCRTVCIEFSLENCFHFFHSFFHLIVRLLNECLNEIRQIIIIRLLFRWENTCLFIWMSLRLSASYTRFSLEGKTMLDFIHLLDFN